MSCTMQSPIISQIQIQKWILYHVNRIMLWVTHINIHNAYLIIANPNHHILSKIIILLGLT